MDRAPQGASPAAPETKTWLSGPPPMSAHPSQGSRHTGSTAYVPSDKVRIVARPIKRIVPRK
eukprot:446277-Pyramimonas_sp.AAC.1